MHKQQFLMIQELEIEKEKIERIIAEHRVKLKDVNSQIRLYREEKRKWPWSDLALRVITLSNSCLTTVEILESIVVNKRELATANRRNYVIGLSVALSNLSKKGLIKKIEISGMKGHFYGLPEWFSHGQLKTEHFNKKPVRYNN